MAERNWENRMDRRRNENRAMLMGDNRGSTKKERKRNGLTGEERRSNSVKSELLFAKPNMFSLKR